MSSPAAAALTTCTLASRCERTNFESAAETSPLAMFSLLAPAHAVDQSRAPLEIVCVVDRSGSMGGNKIMLMKKTLSLLVSRGGMDARDKLGVVTFDDTVSTVLPLTAMDPAGRAKASSVIDAISIGGTTNLSGGLLQGLDMLCRSANNETLDDAADGDGEAAVMVSEASRTCLLFTDGRANAGITQREQLLEAASGVLKGVAGVMIYTFGYGDDHDEDMLRDLAKQSTGLFYHVDQPDAIPAAFADCMGGLVSTVAQNATLELVAPGGRKRSVSIAGVVGDAYKSELSDDGSRLTLQLGDLYADDAKDVLLRLKLAALAEPAPEPQVAVEGVLRYYNVTTKRIEEATAVLAIARPAEAPTEPADIQLDEQRNRCEVAAVIELATSKADAGDIAAGRALLEEAVTKLSRTASCDTPLSRALVGDLRRLALDYEDARVYRSCGSKRSKGSAMCHAQQRSTPMTSAGEVYSAGLSRKCSMSSSFKD